MKKILARLLAPIASVFRRFWASLRRHPIWTVAAIAMIAAAAPAAGAMYLFALLPSVPAAENIQKAKFERPTVVLSADGQELAVFKRPHREWVKLADISPHVVAALLATEDHRFFEHPGVDWRRTLAAVLRTARGDPQGGSTITQQLARNLYPEEIGRAPTFERKAREALTALKIERLYSKNDILETYLNTVPFLYNAYGIEMAARTYFDKPAAQLNVLESATLVGMLKGTSYYNPVLNPERALRRRDTVLAQMVRHGKLEPDRLDALKGRPLGLDFERQEQDLGPAPHLTQQLRRWLISWADRNGYNIYADGLVVRTTIDARMQAMAVEALTRQADKLQALANAAWRKRGPDKELLQAFVRESPQYRTALQSGLAEPEALKKLLADSAFVQDLWNEKTTLQAGLLAVEPGNGHVKAWVGSRDFRQDQFDHVQQARRQPGSTFKPFVYGAAFEQGIGQGETFVDEAIEYRIDERTVWQPTDIGQATGMPMTLREGLVQSRNTITAQLVMRVGPTRVAQLAQVMGVRESKLEAVPALALGTSPVTLKEMVSAYGTIANSGSYIEPLLVTRIENRGHEVLEQFQSPPPQQVLSKPAAQTLLDVMRGVVDKGTAAGLRGRFGIHGDVAGKTGTTQHYTDGWFILMHPQLVSGAWVGFNDNRITMGSTWGQGSRNALNIVGDFVQQAQKAKAIDLKAAFAAPRLPDPPPLMPDNMNEWFNSAYQSTPWQVPQPAIVAEPPLRAPPAQERRWTTELGAPATAPQEYELRPLPPGEGIRILREVTPPGAGRLQ